MPGILMGGQPGFARLTADARLAHAPAIRCVITVVPG